MQPRFISIVGAASTLIASGIACTDDLPEVWEVQDLRVLGIRAEPPEVLDTPVPSQVAFDALIVDPTGARLSYTWSFCPLQSSRACRDYDDRRAEADRRFGALLDDIDNPDFESLIDSAFGPDTIEENYRISETKPDLDAPLTDEVSAYLSEPFTVPLVALPEIPAAPGCDSLEVTDLHMLHAFLDPVAFLSGSWPSAVIEASAGGRTLRAMKRINLTVRDPAALLSCFGGSQFELGFELCPPGQGPEQVPGCIPFSAREPNRNPSFADPPARWHEGDLSNQPFDDLPDPLTVAAGESIRILPVLTDDSEEPYQTIAANLNTGEIGVRDKKEEISISWFVTDGEVQDPLTWPKFTKGLDTAYTAPKRPPQRTAGWVTIWMVARDQRGGIAWTSLPVLVTE